MPKVASGSSSSGRKHGRKRSLTGRMVKRVEQVALSLFWRTFILLVLLLGGGILAWLQTFRALEFEPRALQSAQQLATLVNLSRAALVYADPINRITLIKTLSDEESVRILTREPRDEYRPYERDRLTRLIADELRNRLGPGTIVATSVNERSGLWVGFAIEGEAYWLLADPRRLQAVAGRTWVIWGSIALLASLLGAAVIAGLINRPLKQLSFAASRIRGGEFDSQLDEEVATSEIREVNIGFNRMARELAKIEEDRAVMLAGISHDLRTPLARIRLETEMSVADDEARRNMAADIDQLDAIIDKFLEYARPTHVELHAVSLSGVIDREIAGFRDARSIRIRSKVPEDVRVMADEVELGRVIGNLLENARRYGRTQRTGVAEVEISYARVGDDAVFSVRDRGPGVPSDKLTQLTKPFFRGDTARTAATGAGLGLAIVEKTVTRMRGRFAVSNAPDGGFVAQVRLRRG